MAKSSAKKTNVTKLAKKEENEVVAMAKQLALVLSDTYVLAVKTHGYHWNVMGENFSALHAFFGQQYEALFAAADELAERIRGLGMMPDGSMDSFLQNTVIEEAGPEHLTSEEMIHDLIDSHLLSRQRFAEAEKLAEEIHDVVTQDMMIQRMAATDKTIWMLRSHLS